MLNVNKQMVELEANEGMCNIWKRVGDAKVALKCDLFLYIVHGKYISKERILG